MVQDDERVGLDGVRSSLMMIAWSRMGSRARRDVVGRLGSRLSRAGLWCFVVVGPGRGTRAGR